jgi:drug/metabolite transporter (DMT)-like permease
VVVAALAFATASPLARMADGLSPVGVAAGRCGVAALAIVLLAPGAAAAAVARLDARSRLALAGAGVLLASHFALFLVGLAHTSLPAAVALVSLEPLAVVLAAWVGFRLVPTRAQGAGVVVATLGAVVIGLGAGEGEHRLTGDAMVLGAAALYGAYVMAARGLRDRMPMLPYAASVYGVAFVALLPLALAQSWSGPAPPGRTLVVVVAMGLVPTLVGHTLVQRAARHVPPAVVALVPPGETVGSIAIGAGLLHAWPTTREWMGAAIVLAGVVVASSWRSTSRRS